jgi:hypothetical protein
MTKIKTGPGKRQLRPLKVISRPIRKERVHFEAPKADRLAGEMAFLDRSGGKDLIDPVLKAGLAQH